MVLNQSLKKVLIKKFYNVGFKVNDCNAFFENSYDKIIDNDYNNPFFKKAVFKVKELLNEVDKFSLFIAKFYDDHPEFNSYGSIGVRLGNLFSSSSRRLEDLFKIRVGSSALEIKSIFDSIKSEILDVNKDINNLVIDSKQIPDALRSYNALEFFKALHIYLNLLGFIKKKFLHKARLDISSYSKSVKNVGKFQLKSHFFDEFDVSLRELYSKYLLFAKENGKGISPEFLKYISQVNEGIKKNDCGILSLVHSKFGKGFKMPDIDLPRFVRKSAFASVLVAQLIFGVINVANAGSATKYVKSDKEIQQTIKRNITKEETDRINLSKEGFSKEEIDFLLKQGVYSLERYNPEIVREMIKNQDPNYKKDLPVLLYLINKYDHNNAFKNSLKNLFVQAHKNYKIYFKEVASEKDIVKAVKDASKYKKISFLQLGFHGLPGRYGISNGNDDSSHLDVMDFETIKEISKSLDNNAVVVSLSCSSGAGHMSIAQLLYETFNLDKDRNISLYAPSTVTNADSKYVVDNKGHIIGFKFYNLGSEKITLEFSKRTMNDVPSLLNYLKFLRKVIKKHNSKYNLSDEEKRSLVYYGNYVDFRQLEAILYSFHLDKIEPYLNSAFFNSDEFIMLNYAEFLRKISIPFEFMIDFNGFQHLLEKKRNLSSKNSITNRSIEIALKLDSNILESIFKIKKGKVFTPLTIPSTLVDILNSNESFKTEIRNLQK